MNSEYQTPPPHPDPLPCHLEPSINLFITYRLVVTSETFHWHGAWPGFPMQEIYTLHMVTGLVLECQTIWLQIMTFCWLLSGSKLFYKGYQQMTKVATSNERCN